MRTALAALWAIVVAGCVGNADRGKVAARLSPVISAPADGALSPKVASAFALSPGDEARAAEHIVGVGLGRTRRQARLLEVPDTSRTRVPEGVRELRFWVGDAVATGVIEEGCFVEVRARWGTLAQETLRLDPSPAPAAWHEVRLVAQPARHPSVLEVEVISNFACAGSVVVVPQSVIMPIVPSTLEKRPNLVMVVASGLSRRELDCTDAAGRAAPHVAQRWCARGVFFEQAIAAATTAPASLASMLTGLWPARHGIRAAGGAAQQLSPEAITLAELLQREGYSSFAVVADLEAGPALGRGYDALIERPAAPPGTMSAKLAVDEALAFLAEAQREPFFMTLVLTDLRTDLGAAPAARAENLRAMDLELERLIDYLVDTRLEARTAVVFTSDHAQAVDSPQGALEVPLVVVPPARAGVSPARLRFPGMVAGIDVFATVLGLTGTAAPPTSPARDLSWALEGTTGFERAVVLSEVSAESWVLTTAELVAVQSAAGELAVYDRRREASAPLPAESAQYHLARRLMTQAKAGL